MENFHFVFSIILPSVISLRLHFDFREVKTEKAQRENNNMQIITHFDASPHQFFYPFFM